MEHKDGDEATNTPSPPGAPTYQTPPSAYPPQPPATAPPPGAAAPPERPATAPPPGAPTYQTPPSAYSPQAPTAPASPPQQPPTTPPPGAPTYQAPAPAYPPQPPATAPPPGAPSYQTPASHNSWDTPNTWAGVDKTLLWVAASVAGVALLFSALRAFASNDGESTSFRIGTVLGAAILIGLVTLALWRLVSPKAGTIGAMVVSGLMILTGFTQLPDQPRNREVNDAVTAAIEASGREPRDSTFEPTRAEEACIEDEGVDRDQLLTAFTDTSVQGSDAQLAVVDALLFCAPRFATDQSFLEGMRVSYSAGVGGEVNLEEMQCVTQYLIDNAADPRAVFGGTEPIVILDASDECLRQELLDSLYGAPGTGPQAVGDDAVSDLLFDRCAEGNAAACDVLFVLTSPGSEYHALADTCGGRPLGGDVFCQPGFVDRDGDGFADPESPGWPDMSQRCTDGDMIACDFTFQMSSFGSPTERVGETCGGRSPLAVLGCTERFGEFADE